jgi:hypothetical protein
MQQAEGTANQHSPAVSIAFQTDLIRTDALGGRPTVVAQENWL